MFNKNLFACLAILVMSVFNNVQAASMVDDPELIKLSQWMTGSFDSKKQSIDDEDYFNIHLNMVRIWPQRKDAIWLYVEQAASTALDKPYRQRVYRLSRLNEWIFESAVYTFETPLGYAGDWNKPQPLKGLSPEDLTERQGCAIRLKQQANSFAGSTRAKQCKSKLRGASYATSKVVIEADKLTSWDQGFDDKDKQVWGAEKGAYIFDKSSD